MKSSAEWSDLNSSNFGMFLVISTSCAASGYGSGWSSTTSTVVKIAVLAPMPTASVRIAVTAKPGLLVRVRSA